MNAMLGFRKFTIFIFLLFVVVASCKKNDDLTTWSDFLSRDDSDSKILREYKTWVVNEATIERAGQPTLVYKKGQAIQNNFDPSKISFVFSANNTYQGTDEKGKPESGQWVIDEATKVLKVTTTSSADSFVIVQLTKTNFDFKNDETVDGKVATVTIKMIQKL
jgi:hypothetical protein